MKGCRNTARPGCGGRLCRSAHAHLRQLTVFRHPADGNGQPDFSAAPARGTVCALPAAARSAGGSSVDLPGVLTQSSLRELTAASGTFAPILAVGDRVELEGRLWTVCSAEGTGQVRACLAAEGE